MKKMIVLLLLLIMPMLILGAETVTDSTKAASSVMDVANSMTGGIGSTIQQAKADFKLTVTKVIWAMIIVAIGMVVMRYLVRFMEAIAERWANVRVTIKGLIPAIRITGWSFLIYFIINRILAPPIETFLAVTASAGIAIGFASQDILKNIFGGVMILLDRPFQVGDKIEVGKYYGEVVHIGLRTVRIVTPGDSLVSIPNTEIMNQSVSNANAGQNNCQVIAEFYLPLNVDLPQAKLIAKKSARLSRYIFLNKPVTVIIRNEIHQGRSLIRLSLKAYVLDIRFEFLFLSEMTERFTTEMLSLGLLKSTDIAQD